VNDCPEFTVAASLVSERFSAGMKMLEIETAAAEIDRPIAENAFGITRTSATDPQSPTPRMARIANAR
jgi:hypothetical protein